MNTQEFQALKMAWLAAKETGDMQTQIVLLREHADVLTDFIAAYHATQITEQDAQNEVILPSTRRAFASALERVFGSALPAANLRELRTQRGLSLVNIARELRLGIDVWKKFEDGAIELLSLSEHQLGRLARFFQISSEQFGMLLNNSQPLAVLNRRQKATGTGQQSPKKQSFAEAIKKSEMAKEDKQDWLKN